MEEVVIKADPDEHVVQDEDHGDAQDLDSGDENYYGGKMVWHFGFLDYILSCNKILSILP